MTTPTKKQILKRLIELAENHPEEWIGERYTIKIRGVTIWTENRSYGDMRFYNMSMVKNKNPFNWFERRKLRKAIDSIGTRLILKKLK